MFQHTYSIPLYLSILSPFVSPNAVRKNSTRYRQELMNALYLSLGGSQIIHWASPSFVGMPKSVCLCAVDLYLTSVFYSSHRQGLYSTFIKEHIRVNRHEKGEGLNQPSSYQRAAELIMYWQTIKESLRWRHWDLDSIRSCAKMKVCRVGQCILEIFK